MRHHSLKLKACKSLNQDKMLPVLLFPIVILCPFHFGAVVQVYQSPGQVDVQHILSGDLHSKLLVSTISEMLPVCMTSKIKHQDINIFCYICI